MSRSPDFRSRAAQVAGQAAKEPDHSEVQRLNSIVVYWQRLADLEDWRRDDVPAVGEARTNPLPSWESAGFGCY